MPVYFMASMVLSSFSPREEMAEFTPILFRKSLVLIAVTGTSGLEKNEAKGNAAVSKPKVMTLNFMVPVIGTTNYKSQLQQIECKKKITQTDQYLGNDRHDRSK